MEKTRTYIDKGPTPHFFALEVGGARAHDRVPAARADELRALIRGQPLVVPSDNRAGIEEFVDLAADEEQSLYRLLWLEEGGTAQACLAFGVVSATDDTYDCFGLVAPDASWAARGLEALGLWMGRAGARLLRFEVDSGNAAIAGLALARGFAEEGRIADFYRDGSDQLMLVWRPGR